MKLTQKHVCSWIKINYSANRLYFLFYSVSLHEDEGVTIVSEKKSKFDPTDLSR